MYNGDESQVHYGDTQYTGDSPFGSVEEVKFAKFANSGASAHTCEVNTLKSKSLVISLTLPVTL